MSDQPNVLVIAVDTLRADHLGCYGYRHPTSPNIDALAGRGVLLERFFCAGIPTQPSFTSLYTGQHPVTHGVVAHGGTAELAKEAPFLPHLLLDEGYTTCAVDNLAQMRLWFRRGYEFYIDPSVRHTLSMDVTAEELNARAIPWLRQHADEQFFLFIHYWDPHWPLTPPPRYRHLFYQGTNPTDPLNRSLEGYWKHPLGELARDTWLRRPEGVVTDAAYAEALYDREIRRLDEAVGTLLGALDETGLADDTLVVLLADHGESLTEHGIFFDHHGLYEPVLHVPFIACWPGRIPAGVRLTHMLQHHDVAPTLLDAVGALVPPEMDGQTFWPLLTGATTRGGRDSIVSCECTWQAKWCLRTDRHKFIIARHPDTYGTPDRELYDLYTDPGEERNLVEEEPTLAARMERDLEAWIGERLSALGKPEDPLRQQGPSLSFA